MIKNDESKRKCKNTFLIGNIWEELQKKSPTITKEAKKVYEQTIDWGAHPNERSLFPNIVPKSDGASYALRILNAEPGFLKATIIYTIIVSTLIFRIFSLMLPEIFNQPNLDIKIQNLKKQSTLLMLDASKQLRTMAK